MLTVATGYDDVIMSVAIMAGCCALASLVPPRSTKLGLSYLKTKVCLAVSNRQ
jgi:hypothetical protein